jgi:enoyl-CoA hydratase/carnithine racemase
MSNYARFTALIGAARVKDLIFTARLVEAEEAHAIGLVNEVVDGPEALMVRAQELAKTVAGHAPLTLQATKQALLRLRATIPRGEGDDLIVMCYMSRDFREGMEAFLNKRPPTFAGE